MKIEKNIFICWDDKNVVDHPSLLIKNGLKNVVDLNKDWKVEISDKKDVDKYLKSFLSKKDYKMMKNKHIVEKCDLWRLLKLYNEGGLYIDIDRFYNIPLSDILDENTMCVLPTYLDSDFSQDFMLTASQNPIQQNTINLILERRRQGCDHVYFLGPQTYMHSVTEMLCGKQINSNPSIKIFDQIRERIKSFPFIKTYRENPPHDTIVYKGFDRNLNWQELKTEFYKSYKIKHWTEI